MKPGEAQNPGTYTKVLSALALVAAAALLMLFASPMSRLGERGVAGRTPPDFAFTLEGRQVRLAELKGRVIVLNFWATWCPPCVKEMPSLDRLHAALESEGGMVLGVSVDEDAAAYERFLREHNIRFPNHRDPARNLAAAYGTAMFPETYIIGRDGRMARKIIGPQEWDNAEMLAYLRTLLEDR